ncbi:MAG: hypothetical protein P1V36_15665 [Planctomycetota bacterium]|nr:hypothetical protein [Planctomycetota bacterium]
MDSTCQAPQVHHDRGEFLRSLPRGLRVGFGAIARLARCVCVACGDLPSFVEPNGARPGCEPWPRVAPDS